MSTSNSEEIKKTLENGNLSEVEKQRFEYAWRWFNYHAGQRMQLFNFFLIITGILANAYVGAYEKGTNLMRLAISLIGTLQSFGFLAFDIRSRELTRYAEDILEKIEYDKLFPEGYSDSRINKGRDLGLIICESTGNMREGRLHERGWKNILKMKVWIRSIEIIVGLVFLTGLIGAISQINSHEATTPSQATVNSNSTNQISTKPNSSNADQGTK